MTTQREPLPERRRGVTQKFKLGGQTFYCRTGEYPDGRLGEVFIDAAKEGAMFRSVGNALAIAVSLGLQHGVPLEEYVDAFVGMRFDPAGPVGNHDRLLTASSFLDALFRDLAIHYLGRDDLAHVQAADVVGVTDEPTEYEETGAQSVAPPAPEPPRKAAGYRSPSTAGTNPE